MKKCKKCSIVKDLSEFYKNKAKPDGHAYVCKKCDNERNDKRRKTSTYIASRKKWERENAQKIKEYNRLYHQQYYAKNKDKIKEYNYRWIAENYEKWKQYGRTNFQKPRRKLKHKVNQAFRRARLLVATIKGYESEIFKIYENCPKGYHVDHIVPLRGKNVCGLHVPWNLQYLPAKENRKKSNKVIL